MFLLGVDSQGQVQYRRTFGGGDDDFGSAVTRTRDGGVVLAGATRSFASTAGDRDIWLVRTDANGVEQWSRTYGGPRSESSAAVVQSDDGGYTVAGDTFSYGAGRFDAWIVRTDADGEVDWTRTVGGSGQDSTRGLVETADGGYVVVGRTETAGSGADDAWLFRLAGADEPAPSRPIEECGAVLDEPGRYVLRTDLDHQGDGACLTVRASEVTIDGQGNQITADDRTGTGVRIENPDGRGLADVTVENLVVVGFERGISHHFSDPLIRLRVTGTTVERSGTAMQLHDVTDLVVARNRVVDNEWGISIEDFGSGVRVRDNRIERNRKTGLLLFEGGDGPVVSENVVAENGRGIWASNELDDSVFVGNRVVDNGGVGIKVGISQDVVVRGNDVARNDGFGIGLDSADGTIADNDVGSNGGAGISLEFADGTVGDNEVGSNGGAGISLVDSAADVTENIVRANGGAGVSIVESSAEIEGNELIANDGAGVTVTGGEEQDSTTRLVDNRIAGNCGAGIQFDRGTGVVLSNDIGENAACG
jgi:parallel beta-helix repeat protein